MRPDETVLKINHAHKYYNRGKSNELHVMNDVDLSLPSSGMVAIFGQSGCGKTTLLNAVGGLDTIASGSIELFGENLASDTDTLRNKYVGYVFQNYNLNVSETVFDNVADALRLCGMTDPAELSTRVLAALKNVGMDKFKSRTPDTLSGGQQQRVAIARALVKNPAVLLADEPTGNLDEANTVMIMDLLKEISKTHLVLLVTHEANLVDYYCDRVIRIVDGSVTEDRENEGANGYIARDKNDIYLGELEKTEESVSGVTLTCYGKPEVPVKLRLVTSGGRTYLVCDTPDVRFLDESSEIRLREGVFRQERRQVSETSDGTEKTGADPRHELDMSALTPFEGKHFGRLYSWKNALSSAWNDNFAKKQKKGTVLLRVTLALLAIVIVFTTAISAVSIRGLVDLYRDHDPNLFFVRLTPDGDFSHLNDLPVTAGIDGKWLTGASVWGAEELFTFETAQFMTARAPIVQGSAYAAPLTLLRDPVTAAGTATPAGPDGVVITTALGDELIESSSAAYLDGYEDLIGLISSIRGSYGQSSLIRIAGVVLSDERMLYMDPLAFAERIHSGAEDLTSAAGVYAMSRQGSYRGTAPGKGEIVILDGILEAGETVRIFGQDFRVVYSDRSATFNGLTDYYLWYLDKTGLAITTASDYAENAADEAEAFRKTCEWVFEVFPQEGAFRDFCRLLVSNYVPWISRDMTPELWYYAETGDMRAYLYLLEQLNGQSVGLGTGSAYHTSPLGSCYDAYACLKYREKTGEWPDSMQTIGDDTFREAYAAFENSAIYDFYPGYEAFMNSATKQSKPTKVLSDADYIALAGCVGPSDEAVSVYAFDSYEETWADGGVYYQNHMVLHASDPEAAEEFLAREYGDLLVTPDSIFRDMLAEGKGEIIAGAVTILVMVGLMCLCVFFIMRASFMHRVREVGIARAIGVTKRNLVFRFAVEALLLVCLTVVPGFLFSSLLIIYLSGGVLLGTIFYFPVWMAAALLILLIAASVFFGVLPVMLLLRRTPAEILSKYDI